MLGLLVLRRLALSQLLRGFWHLLNADICFWIILICDKLVKQELLGTQGDQRQLSKYYNFMGTLKYILLFLWLEILPMIYNELIHMFIGTYWVYTLFSNTDKFFLEAYIGLLLGIFSPPPHKPVKNNVLTHDFTHILQLPKSHLEQHTGRLGMCWSFCSHHLTNSY